jgi:hypothetical protein
MTSVLKRVLVGNPTPTSAEAAPRLETRPRGRERTVVATYAFRADE